MVKMYFKRVKRIQYGRAVNNLEVSADKKFITVWHMLWEGMALMEAIMSRVPVKYAKKLPVGYVITNGRTWTASEWREWYKSVKVHALYRMWRQRTL